MDILLTDPKRWFTRSEIDEHYGGPAAYSLITALVVAGLVEANENLSYENKYHVDPYWYQVYKKQSEITADPAGNTKT